MKLSYKQKYFLLRNSCILIRNILAMIFLSVSYGWLGYKALLIGGIIVC